MNDLEMYKAWLDERVEAGDVKAIQEDIVRRAEKLANWDVVAWSTARWRELDRLAGGR
jgi:hypothetical protein